MPFANAATSAAETAAQKAAHAPKVELSVYRRSYTTDEKVSVRMSSYNVKRLAFTVYRVDLSQLVPNPSVLGHFEKVIAALPLGKLPVAKRFGYWTGKVYPDQWSEFDVRVPILPAGVYLIEADGAGAGARTWFAVTDIALVSKRSRQAITIFAANARSGKPVADVALTAVDKKGNRISGSTGVDGVWRAKTASLVDDNLWVNGLGNGQPAFILSGDPQAAPPFTVYAYTDRPIYRPGQTVDFKGIVRACREAEAPGGFVYKNYAGQPVVVEIRDATDALISRQRLTTNKFGAFDGSLALAPEPPLGKWQLVVVIGDFRNYAGFDVQEYRKPEFTTGVSFDKSYYVSGDKVEATISATYYFGDPVSSAKVHYSVNFSGPGDRIEPNYEADAVTDKSGQVKIEIPTKRIPTDRSVTISATITDLSRRQMQAGGSAQIFGGLFELSVSANQGTYRPGDVVTATATATDHDNKPVKTAVEIDLVETLYDNKHRPYEERTSRKVVTDPKTGAGSVTFKPARPDSYSLEAVAFDANDDKITGAGSFTVTRDETPDDDDETSYPDLSLTVDKDTYKPGETASIELTTGLVTTTAELKRMIADRAKQRAAAIQAAKQTHQPIPAEDPMPVTYDHAWALLTVQGERLYRQFVLPLKDNTANISIPVSEDYFPSVEVSAVIVQERHIVEQAVTLNVERHEQELTVDVEPDKKNYQPGEQATYTITTHDWKNRPVPAEVSLGVVDSSIYAIEEDSTPTGEAAFYGGQEVRVQTDFSFAAQYSGGAYQTVPGTPGGGAAGGIRVRKQFADTACWQPFVDTGANGVGKLTFTMPDNLTGWRATARGITESTQVGEATANVTSSMPLMVRLEQPRFYVQGDDTVLSAIVHNYTGSTRTVDVSLKVTGLSITGESEQKLTMDSGTEKRIDWKAHVTGPDAATVTVIADGGPGAQDAMQTSLKVLPDGLKMYEAHAYVLGTHPASFLGAPPETGGGGEGTASLDISALQAGSTLTVTLSPSVASSMFDTLDYLTNYPYGCAEQTMSALMPDVFVGRSLHKLGVSKPLHADPDRLVNFGLQKLYRYQHPDGGWHWWETDQSDPEMTSYVLWGLCQARDAGYTVDDQRIARGAVCLEGFLANEQDPSERAEYLASLACADPAAAAKPLQALYAKRGDLDTFGLASLSLALRQAGGKLLPEGDAVARDLEGQVKDVQDFSYWPTGETGYTWHADTVFVTAHALRAVLASDPESPIVPRVVAWLMAQREGDAWSTTRTSAEVVYALSKYMEISGEVHPRYTAKVLLDGQEVKNVDMDDASVFADPSTFTLTSAQLAGHKTLTVQRAGDSGVLYAEAGVSYTIDPAHVSARNDGLSVTRSYQVTADDPSKANEVVSGIDIPVHVDIQTDVAYPHVMLEEPIPASCEVEDDDNGGAYTRREVHDDRVVFFFDNLPAGDTGIDYVLRTESTGSYRILPGIATIVYHPEMRGNTGLARVNVKDSE